MAELFGYVNEQSGFVRKVDGLAHKLLAFRDGNHLVSSPDGRLGNIIARDFMALASGQEGNYERLARKGCILNKFVTTKLLLPVNRELLVIVSVIIHSHLQGVGHAAGGTVG